MSGEDTRIAAARRITHRSRPTPDLGIEPPEWTLAALCQQTDPELFYPEKGGSTAAAKRICAQCTVRSECLEDALLHTERYGIWGGMSERERRRLVRAGGAA